MFKYLLPPLTLILMGILIGLHRLNSDDNTLTQYKCHFYNFTLCHFQYFRRCRLAQEYRKQLQMQISYQQQVQEAKKEEERREFEAGLAEQKMFEEKVKELLCIQKLPKAIHPMRRGAPC